MLLEPDTASNLKEPFDRQINYRSLDFRVLTQHCWLWGEHLYGTSHGQRPCTSIWG